MVTVIPWILDPTESDIEKLKEKNVGHWTLSSSNPKDNSLSKGCIERNMQVVFIAVDKPSFRFGDTFGFGQSEDDFMGYLKNVDDLILMIEKASEASDSVLSDTDGSKERRTTK